MHFIRLKIKFEIFIKNTSHIKKIFKSNLEIAVQNMFDFKNQCYLQQQQHIKIKIPPALQKYSKNWMPCKNKNLLYTLILKVGWKSIALLIKFIFNNALIKIRFFLVNYVMWIHTF